MLSTCPSVSSSSTSPSPSQTTRSTPSASRSRASICSRESAGLRLGCSRHCSVVISVPSPSTAIEPPSRIRSPRVDALLPQVLEHARGERRVVVVGGELLAPGVEAEVHAGARALAGDEDRAGVARPRVVERDRDDVDVAAHRGAGLGLLRRVDGERDRLEGGDRVDDGGVLGLRVGEALLPHRLARGPADDGALVRRPLRRHPHAVAHFVRSLRVRERSSWRSITLWISFRISDRARRLDVAGLERLAPVADLALLGELVEVRARDGQADLRVGRDVARDLRARGPGRGRAGCRRGPAARARRRA